MLGRNGTNEHHVPSPTQTMLWASDVDVGEGTWVKDLHCSLVPLPMLWPSTSVMGLHCARWRNPNLSCRSSHALEAVRLATPETTLRPCSWTSTPPWVLRPCSGLAMLRG